jgi:hypothetical protein
VGHNRLGALPKTQEWREVIALLDAPAVNPLDLAGAVMAAAHKRFQLLGDDPALGFWFWLLVRIASAARKPGFAEEMAHLGLPLPADIDAPTFVEVVADRVEERLAALPASNHFTDIAQLALRTALIQTVGPHGRNTFNSTLSDLPR